MCKSSSGRRNGNEGFPRVSHEYRRSTGAVSVKEYSSLTEAARTRAVLDERNDDSGVDIATIAAPRLESLRHTHARYFYREDVLFPAAS